MVTCPTCSADLVDSATSCRACGALLTPDAVATMAPASGTIEGRFQIGTTVVGRYRILGLLGRGGMGEVYRAHDIKLDQQVALKFLPEALGRDGAAVARFHNEVRRARGAGDHRSSGIVVVSGLPQISQKAHRPCHSRSDSRQWVERVMCGGIECTPGTSGRLERSAPEIRRHVHGRCGAGTWPALMLPVG